MDHSKHTRLRDDELLPPTLEGATIYGPDDSTIGTVSEVFDIGPARQVVVDVGGFLGIGAKPVAVAVADLDFMRDEDGSVHAVSKWSKEEIEALPEFTPRVS